MANEEIDWKEIYKFHQSKTMLFFCKTSYQHADFNSEYRSKDYQKETQVENSDRVRAVMKPPFGIIHRNSLSNASIIRGAFPARLGDITRVHDANYIKKIKDKCEEIEDGDITDFDPDTSMSRETWEASINSSGSCLEAARRIMRKEGKNAFCCIRPPGHHAGLYGKAEVDIEELEHVQNTLECESIARPHCTNGFCFVNNACITAAYLKTFYPDEIQKVVIIDFDVHHGNGTEQIVECLNPKSVTFETYNQYFGACKFKKNLYKPWCDEDDFKNILFVSTHSYEISPGKNFYPGSGSTFKNTNPGDPSYPGGILNIPFQESSYSMTWRMNYLQQVLPRLFEFKPDFILISAGFDGHCKDLLGEISPLSLTEFDYAWLTKELVKISNTLCEGRIISMLEGGYNTTGEGLYSPLANSIFYHFLELSHNYGQKYIDPEQEFLNRKRRYENMS